ncbi:organic hydroperoxide resistance protein [Deefgea tanakiae]|jgi:osmotically inducible protein OsmC|uniref:Organic hydroperoxide resistance protein n=1 Tax=Deefgea tanakiae TaxID=2865840 RepID=A0ABX8ZBR3_9NEIS|nr:organic hydroperoxide resistance protein [Deefgea tanakiae]QZA78600.1 organic hydroperoxide resistance protein [Deefgea tanakiae]
MKIFYQTRATAMGGRSGHAQLDDGSLSFDLAMPGTGKAGVNPEQLFAIGYAACFDNALALTAQKMKLPVSSSQTSAAVGLGQNTAGGYSLDIDLYIEVRGISEGEAQALVEATHQICPYSNAVRGNIEVRLHINQA